MPAPTAYCFTKGSNATTSATFGTTLERNPDAAQEQHACDQHITSKKTAQQIDIAAHAQLCSSLVRIAQRIGINRRLKNVTPDLRDYLEATNRTDDDVGVPR